MSCENQGSPGSSIHHRTGVDPLAADVLYLLSGFTFESASNLPGCLLAGPSKEQTSERYDNCAHRERMRASVSPEA
jgi:hypothetical protein